MMRFNIVFVLWFGVLVVVFSVGLGGGGGYWLVQCVVLEEQYQLVSYDYNGIGENVGLLFVGYSLVMMVGELFSVLQVVGIVCFVLVGYVLGVLIGLQLVFDCFEVVSVLVLVNGWLLLLLYICCCFQVCECLLYVGGVQVWVEVQLLFFYLVEWMVVCLLCFEVEDVFVISYFQGKENLLKWLQVLKQVDFLCCVLVIVCLMLIISVVDDLLVFVFCFCVLQMVIFGSQFVEMLWGGYVCNVIDVDIFNIILCDGLFVMLLVIREI